MQINILLKILKFNFIIGKKILLKNIKIGITKLVRNRFHIIIINEILKRKIWKQDGILSISWVLDHLTMCLFFPFCSAHMDILGIAFSTWILNKMQNHIIRLIYVYMNMFKSSTNKFGHLPFRWTHRNIFATD